MNNERPSVAEIGTNSSGSSDPRRDAGPRESDPGTDVNRERIESAARQGRAVGRAELSGVSGCLAKEGGRYFAGCDEADPKARRCRVKCVAAKPLFCMVTSARGRGKTDRAGQIQIFRVQLPVEPFVPCESIHWQEKVPPATSRETVPSENPVVTTLVHSLGVERGSASTYLRQRSILPSRLCKRLTSPVDSALICFVRAPLASFPVIVKVTTRVARSPLKVTTSLYRAQSPTLTGGGGVACDRGERITARASAEEMR